VLHQLVSSQAELENQVELVSLQIFDAAPNQVRGLLGGEGCEVTLVNEQNFLTCSAQGRGCNCSVDAGPDNCNVKLFGLNVFVRIRLILFGHTASIGSQAFIGFRV